MRPLPVHFLPLIAAVGFKRAKDLLSQRHVSIGKGSMQEPRLERNGHKKLELWEDEPISLFGSEFLHLGLSAEKIGAKLSLICSPAATVPLIPLLKGVACCCTADSLTSRAF